MLLTKTKMCLVSNMEPNKGIEPLPQTKGLHNQVLKIGIRKFKFVAKTQFICLSNTCEVK